MPTCGLHSAHCPGFYSSEGNGLISKNENFKELTWAPPQSVSDTVHGPTWDCRYQWVWHWPQGPSMVLWQGLSAGEQVHGTEGSLFKH